MDMNESVSITDSPFRRPVEVDYSVHVDERGEEIMVNSVIVEGVELDGDLLSDWVVSRLIGAVDDSRAARDSERW